MIESIKIAVTSFVNDACEVSREGDVLVLDMNCTLRR